MCVIDLQRKKSYAIYRMVSFPMTPGDLNAGFKVTVLYQRWMFKNDAFYYRAMHFSAKRGIAIACRLSVRLSVCLSVTLVDCDHIGWNYSKIISPLVSLGCFLFATPTWRVCSKGNTPKFGAKVTHPLLIWASETFDRKLRPNGYR